MKICRRFFVSFFVLIWFGVSVQAQNNGTYKKEIEDWYNARVQSLTADNGWLNLVGLSWLEEGRSTFEKSSENKLVFPATSPGKEAGYFDRSGDTVRLVVENNAAIKINDKPIKEAVIFNGDLLNVSIVSFGSLQWNIIKRDDKIGVRVRDLKSPLPKAFKGINRFAVDAAWNIPAQLQTGTTNSNIAITNVLGQTTLQKSPGKLVFTIHNKQYSLDALEEGDELFILFADGSNGKTTYPSGRFLNVKMPGKDGKTFIDFNKAYNPPCAFTPFATCPIPPRQNVLPIAITAGEKNYGHH